MRALLAQWRMDVRWCRGGLPPTGVLPPLLLLLPGGVSGSTPPLMAQALRYSDQGEHRKRKHFRNRGARLLPLATVPVPTRMVRAAGIDFCFSWMKT
jgi:hypothetical protein